MTLNSESDAPSSGGLLIFAPLNAIYCFCQLEPDNDAPYILITDLNLSDANLCT